MASRKAADQAKRDWLLAHATRWHGISRDDPRLKVLAKELMTLGFYSMKTSEIDVEVSVLRYITWLREHKRDEVLAAGGEDGA